MKTSLKHLFLLPALIAGLGLIPAGRVTAQTFTTLYNFTGNPYEDDANPAAGLVLSGNTLYGTTQNGGSSGFGTVFAVNTDGSGYSILHSFTRDTDGDYPTAGLVLSGNTLYGTTQMGGTCYGSVFAVNTDGTGFRIVHCFQGDGPRAPLILSGNTLYGTTCYGTNGFGSVFAVNTDGSGYSILHGFTNDSDGALPSCSLVLSGNTLYGAAEGGSGGTRIGYGVRRQYRWHSLHDPA